MPSVQRLAAWDYVSMSLLVAAASCVGLYHVFASGKSKNTREFLVTSRDLGLIPLILSTVATFLSAVGFLGFPMEVYTNGGCFMTMSLSFLIVIPFGIYLYLPVFYELGYSSIFEYLESRFNRSLRQYASTLTNLNLLLYTSCVIYAPALALNQVTGLHLWASVATIAIVCIIYTSMGGIKAVVWADATQVVVMCFVLLMIIIKGIADQGGIGRVWQICQEGHRADIFLFSPSPYSSLTIWPMVVGGAFHYVYVIANNQMFMQRYMSNKTINGARKSFIWGTIGIIFMTVLYGIGGFIIYAKYHDCDPLLNNQVTSRDQLMALFAVETLSFQKGMPGIFVAAILCATLSTLSSSLNTMATITMEDYILPIKPNLSDSTAMKLSKCLGVVYGVICVALVAIADSMGGLIKTVISIAGVTGGPVLGLFTMGMLFPWVSTKGATIGFLSSILLPLWACIGNLVTHPTLNSAPVSTRGCNMSSDSVAEFNLTSFVDIWDVSPVGASQEKPDDSFALYSMNSFWYVCWSTLIGCTVGLLISVTAVPQNPNEVDSKLLFPFVRRICANLPEKHRAALGFKPKDTIYCQLAVNATQSTLISEKLKMEGPNEINGTEVLQLLKTDALNEKQ